MRKKYLCLIVVLLLFVGATGCASDSTEEKRVEDSADFTAYKEFGVKNEKFEKFQLLKPYTAGTRRKDYVIYLPQDEVGHDGSSETVQAYGSGGGVDFLVMVNPDLNYDRSRYNPYQHSMEENLNRFVDYMRNKTNYYKQLSEVEFVDAFEEGNGAAAYVSYLKEVDGEYYPLFEEYYMFYDGESFVIATTIIYGDFVDKKTEALLAEIEEYLDYTIYYDEDLLPQVPTESLGDISDQMEKMEYTDFWEFPLPAGWKYVEGSSDTDQYAYSPNGRLTSSPVVYIGYLGEDEDDFLRKMDIEALEDYYKRNLTFSDTDMQLGEIVVLGELPVGYVIKYSMYDEYLTLNSYLIEDGNSALVVHSIDETGDEQAAEVAEYIITHAQKRYE